MINDRVDWVPPDEEWAFSGESFRHVALSDEQLVLQDVISREQFKQERSIAE